MLVKAKRDVQAYGPMVRLKKNHLYIVYAIEDNNGKVEYSVLRAQKPVNGQDNQEPDPLFFPCEEFTLIADHVSSSWESRMLQTGRGLVKYTSFPEWFENDFWIRAHDWDLEGNDFKIIKKYKHEYEKLYESYL